MSSFLSRLAFSIKPSIQKVLTGRSYDGAATAMDATKNTATGPLTNQLNFKIPDATLRSLHQARESRSRHIHWDIGWYKNDAGKGVRVSYADNLADSETLAQRFIGETILGFDMEWKPCYNKGQVHEGIKNNVSLIQLARDGEIGLFHIARHKGSTTSELIAPTLVKIIRNAGVTKAGVNIYGSDATRLRHYTGIEAKGLFELSRLHFQVVNHDTVNNKEAIVSYKAMRGLAKQVEFHLGFPLAKGKVRTSDWTLPLSEAQRKYAAADAYAGLVLYHTMNAKRLQLIPVPPLPSCTEVPDVTAHVVRAVTQKLKQEAVKIARTGKDEMGKGAERGQSDDDAFEVGDDKLAPRPRFRMPPPLLSPQSPELDLPDSDFGPTIQSHLFGKGTTARSRTGSPVRSFGEETSKDPSRANGRASPRDPLQALALPTEQDNIAGRKRKRDLQTAKEANVNKRTQIKTKAAENPAEARRAAAERILDALNSLRRQLVVANPAHKQAAMLPYVSRETFKKIAEEQPSTLPQLCRIPGAVPFMQFCDGHDVDLLSFVKSQIGK